VNARSGTNAGESVCSRFVASFTGRHEMKGGCVMSASSPDTTEGVLDRYSVRSSPGVCEAVLACR